MVNAAPLPTPPGSLGLPFLGETLEFFGDRQFAQKRHDRYGAIFKTQLLGRPTIVLKGPEANRFVLTNENKYFQVSWPPSVKQLLGPLSLALQTGGIHAQRRKLLVQAFAPRALEQYIPTLEQITQRYCDRWLTQGTLAWFPELRHYTFDVAGQLFMGLTNASETPLGHWFEIWSQGLFSIPLNLPWTRFGKAYRSRRLILTELERLIRDRQTQRSEESAPADDALGIMLTAEDENGERLTVEELKDQVLLLLFAGHETLTSALAAFCLTMAQHPEQLAAARAEQKQFQNQPLTLETLKSMTYLEQILKEVLRFIPPVGGGFRTVLQDCDYGGYRIPEGWGVLYEINQTHYDAAVFPDPKQFDPERFNLEHQDEKRPPFSHVPFGGGMRECLGKEFARLEIKVFAALLLRQYQWELLPDQDLSLMVVPTPRPRDDLKVRFGKL
ncbi:MAG: cytochrome P450 [Spirulina sp. SIO3F2]|nr:cytochrome P450 [Spirulina sp. SIO3F2]